MSQPLAVAIVGAGLMGRWHARYAEAEGARVVGIIDLREERAFDLARRFRGARAFARLDDCLRTAGPKVVHVCTDRLRAELAREALEGGGHALVEKPAAQSRAEASLLLQVAERNRLLICPVHQFGFQHGFRRVLRERSRLGDLVALRGRVASAGAEGRSGAERREILRGMVPHFLSLFRALSGPLAPDGWQTLAATDDDLEIAARTKDLSLHLSLSLRERPRRNELVVVGTRARARLDLYHGFALFQEGPVSRAAKALAPFREAGGLAAAASANVLRRLVRGESAFPGLRDLVGAFYRSVADGGPPPLSSDELLESAGVLERLGPGQGTS